jgi:RimJ/RimL family protein N-acetyltransferase
MLTGALVRLRAIEMEDLDRYLAWVNDEEVMRHVAATAFPLSRGQEEEFVREATKRTRPPEVVYAIETLEDGRHIGSIGLHKIDGIARNCELGVMIGDKTHWDRGYGTDTITTALHFAFEELNLNRVWLSVDADNGRASPAIASADSSRKAACARPATEPASIATPS